ncbi:6-N-hydroxylaminopurine resistance protein [Bremerella volcania]|uniref:6-N-hydroxylaminopurine resistance protein n=2 Tax=Bremerella volcania TaxID=2527984 RepID=A0A518CBD8_9BACT|nr:6-N-hydroxylaminopurine resistance protein [Bremerella volcania]
MIGFENDGHRYEEHYAPKRAVTLFNREILDRFEPDGEAFPPGSVGENITVAGIDLGKLAIGTRLAVGEAEIQLEKPWKPCHATNAASGQSRVNEREHLGFFASVVRPGTIRRGDVVEVL